MEFYIAFVAVQLVDLLVISYALVLLFHPEYTLLPTRYPDLYESNKHYSDVIQTSTVETDHAATVPALNLTTGFSGNTTSPLPNICWSNCGVLHF